MEHGLGDYLRGLENEEDAGLEACLRAAQKYGLTQEQAQSCDAGEHGCPECPWRTEP